MMLVTPLPLPLLPQAYPDLYLSNLADQEAGARPVRELLERAINSPVMRSSPEVGGGGQGGGEGGW